MKKVLILSGSPRKSGNSDILCDEFMRGAIEAGNEVEKIRVTEKKIAPCTGCYFCRNSGGRCALNDDMTEVLQKIIDCDVLVLSSPVYFYSICAQLKAVIDRLYVTENREFSISGAILLATYATAGSEMSRQTEEYFKCLLDYHEWENKGIITVSSLDEKDDIVGNEALLYAEHLGESI